MMEKVNEKALYIRIDAKDGKNMKEKKHITCITFNIEFVKGKTLLKKLSGCG